MHRGHSLHFVNQEGDCGKNTISRCTFNAPSAGNLRQNRRLLVRRYFDPPSIGLI